MFAHKSTCHKPNEMNKQKKNPFLPKVQFMSYSSHSMRKIEMRAGSS